MKSYILLNELHFHAFHGVGTQEQLVGNDFVVSLKLRTDLSRAMQSDEVNDTVSYADVFQSVKEEMEMPSQLLEHVAGRIIQRLFDDYPTVEEITLTLLKRNPPMNADIASAGVEVTVKREDDMP